MAELNYTTRSMRRRRGTDMWEISLSHKNPLTGEVVRTYHTVEAKTQRQAERKRDELILDLERKGGAIATGVTVTEFMDVFLDYKEVSGHHRALHRARLLRRGQADRALHRRR